MRTFLGKPLEKRLPPKILKRSCGGAVTFDETEKARGGKKKAPLSEISEMRRKSVEFLQNSLYFYVFFLPPNLGLDAPLYAYLLKFDASRLNLPSPTEGSQILYLRHPPLLLQGSILRAITQMCAVEVLRNGACGVKQSARTLSEAGSSNEYR